MMFPSSAALQNPGIVTPASPTFTGPHYLIATRPKHLWNSVSFFSFAIATCSLCHVISLPGLSASVLLPYLASARALTTPAKYIHLQPLPRLPTDWRRISKTSEGARTSPNLPTLASQIPPCKPPPNYPGPAT